MKSHIEENIPPTSPLTDEEVEGQIRRMTRRSFSWGAAGALLGAGGWGWLITRAEEQGLPWPFRRVLDFNERVAQAAFSAARLAPTFALHRAREPRVNGEIGLGDGFDPAAWKLRVETALRPGREIFLTLAEIRELPHVEIVTELKCVEGWSQIVHWGGVRLADFAAKYQLVGPAVDYVNLQTPKGDYFVGLDLPSSLHSQTLLCYEMNGAPLSLGHGAPLRLVTPLKYGIKHIKRIGSIEFTSERPRDYWADRGYDWYAGH